MMWNDLTITTSCSGYGQYLNEWSNSIIAQTVKPGQVVIFTHGTPADEEYGRTAFMRLRQAGLSVLHTHYPQQIDFGSARNRAVALTASDWVLHLDADDTLQLHAIEMFQALSHDADVISAGYTRTGRITSGMSTKDRVYDNMDGTEALDAPALCSSNSPFRRAFWEQSPYREDMHGAWDTAFWIGLAHLGARFRATPRPVFNYRQHPDSVFNRRQRTMSWARVHTTAMLRALRARWDGVAVIVPRDYCITIDRQHNWEHVRLHYRTHHPNYEIVEGHCPSAQWCKGAAIQNALRHTGAEILVIADADCIIDPYWLTSCVELVRNGAPWAVPHRMVNRLTEDATRLFLEEKINGQLGFDANILTRERYEGVAGGGIVVLRRIHYDAIGGIPQAFIGWGSEDRALGLLCEKLLGPCARGEGELIHLYHHPQPKTRLTQQNVQVLQRLGQAAQHGADMLVAAVATLPKSGMRTLQNARIPSPVSTQPVFAPKQRRRLQ